MTYKFFFFTLIYLSGCRKDVALMASVTSDNVPSDEGEVQRQFLAQSVSCSDVIFAELLLVGVLSGEMWQIEGCGKMDIYWIDKNYVVNVDKYSGMSIESRIPITTQICDKIHLVSATYASIIINAKGPFLNSWSQPWTQPSQPGGQALLDLVLSELHEHYPDAPIRWSVSPENFFVRWSGIPEGWRMCVKITNHENEPYLYSCYDINNNGVLIYNNQSSFLEMCPAVRPLIFTQIGMKSALK